MLLKLIFAICKKDKLDSVDCVCVCKMKWKKIDHNNSMHSTEFALEIDSLESIAFALRYHNIFFCRMFISFIFIGWIDDAILILFIRRKYLNYSNKQYKVNNDYVLRNYLTRSIRYVYVYGCIKISTSSRQIYSVFMYKYIFTDEWHQHCTHIRKLIKIIDLTMHSQEEKRNVYAERK